MERAFDHTVAPLAAAPLLALLSACSSEATEGQSSAGERRVLVPEELAIGEMPTMYDHPEPTDRQLARRERAFHACVDLGLPTLANKSLLPDDEAVDPHPPIDIARRAAAILVCACAAEGQDVGFGRTLVQRYALGDFMSADERVFLNGAPDEQTFIDMCWRYECAHVLLWSLGHVDEIGPPNQVCDAGDTVRHLSDRGSAEQLAMDAAPREIDEILDAAELHAHMLWGLVELRLDGKSTPRATEGIVRERLRALNWLIRLHGRSWDETRTDA